MRRLKQIALVLTAILSGAVLTEGVYALQFSDNATELTFTYTPTLTLTLSSTTMAIEGLTPGVCRDGGGISVTVDSNSSSGYTLSATIGASGNTGRTLAGNPSGSFSMITADGKLSAGNWGIRIGDSTVTDANCPNTTYKTIAAYGSTGTTINKTTNMSGTAASGYTGSNSTPVRLAAYASATQPAGAYTNTINFTAVSN